MKYVRITKGVKDKGRLIPPAQVKELINSDSDYYVSTYNYDDSNLVTYKQNNNSVAGIKNLTTNKIWWDFDNESNLNLAQEDAKTVVRRLLDDKYPESAIDIYFSGNKGFSVEVLVDNELTRKQVEFLALKKYGSGLASLDSSMYDFNQLFRIPNTKHQKSGLYKIQLTINQLNKCNIELIKEKAKTILPLRTKTSVMIPEAYLLVPELEKKPVVVTSDLGKPRHWKDFKWAIAQGNFESGERHHALMVLAATCKGLGYDRDMALAMCTVACQKQAERTKGPVFDLEELEENVIDGSVYSASWQGGQYSPESDAWLAKYCERMGFDTTKDKHEIIKISDIKTKFAEYVKHIEENTILTGIHSLDKRLPLTTGMNLGIVGAASSGKTALALKILENTSRAGVVSVMASLDMHRNRLFEKLLYRDTGLSREVLYQKFKDNDTDAITKSIDENYGNVWFYDRSMPSVDNIRKYIMEIQEQTGQKVKLVMIDYFERINSEKSEDTAASKDIAGRLQDLVNDLDICLVTLVQPHKNALHGGPDSPITSYTSIKGSSFLYQSFRSIISIWRPFFTPELKDHDKFMQMAILKNDLGELDLLNYAWSGKRGEISELEVEGQEELKSLLKQKADSKNAANEDDW
jgi:hypothetical protein